MLAQFCVHLCSNILRPISCVLSLALIMCLMWPKLFCNNISSNQTLHRIINTVPIESLVIESPLHDNRTKYGLVLLVICAQSEKEERNEIRRQWASINESEMQKTKRSLVIFVVSKSSSLAQETSIFGDLLQIDLEESYRNMVYKIESSYRWVKQNIESEFVVKVDSDTVVHIDRLYDQLKRNERIQSGDWLACYSGPHFPPIRDKCSPWYVSDADYPLDFFPPYCNGPAYVMKRATFDKIVERMKMHKIIEIEDAFFTGIVAGEFTSIVLSSMFAEKYTDFSNCDAHGPTLSFLNTHKQFGQIGGKNLTAAWERLKRPQCYNSLTKLFLA